MISVLIENSNIWLHFSAITFGKENLPVGLNVNFSLQFSKYGKYHVKILKNVILIDAEYANEDN